MFNLDEVIAWRASRDPPTSLRKARLDKAVADAHRAQLIVEQKESEVVDVELAKTAWEIIRANAEKRLTALSEEIPAKVLGLSSIREIKEEIDRCVFAALADLDAFELPPQQTNGGASRTSRR